MPQTASSTTENFRRPVFSVVMPAYNADHDIERAIKSVQTQTFENLELIVVDDCSQDNTVLIVKSIADADLRIKLIRQPFNQGVAATRNTAIAAAKGRYIGFLDSDDEWLPSMLENIHQEFQNGHNAIHSGYFRVSNGKVTSTVYAKTASFKKFFFWNPVGNLTGFYDLDRLGRVFQKTIPHEDYLMWFEVTKKAGQIHAIKLPLARYTVSANSLSGNKKRAAIWHWNLLRKNMSLNVISAAFCFVVYAIRAVALRLSEKVKMKNSTHSTQQ